MFTVSFSFMLVLSQTNGKVSQTVHVCLNCQPHDILLFSGILYVTNTEQKLSEVHSKLMSQNASLHSLLEQPEDRTTPTNKSHDSGSESHDRGSLAEPPSHQHAHTRGGSRTLPGGYVEHSV